MGTRNPIPHASILDSEGACSSELQCERDRGQERVAGDLFEGEGLQLCIVLASWPAYFQSGYHEGDMGKNNTP